MNGLETILNITSCQLSEAGVDCILIGGFAVNYYGYTRNTLDIDFMIFTEQLAIVRDIMTQSGFTNITIEDTVAFFNNPDLPMRIDFLRVDKDTIQKLSANAIKANIHGYEIKIPALKDLIAMKVFSLSQNTARRMAKDLPDIAYLCVLNSLDLKSDILPLCNRFGTPEVYNLISSQVKEMVKP